MKPFSIDLEKRSLFAVFGTAVLWIAVSCLVLGLGFSWFVQRLRSVASPVNVIVHNLRVIDSQKHAWADERKKGDNNTPSEADLSPYFQNGKFPPAVIGETYHINPVGQRPTATTPSRLRWGKLTIEAGSVITIPDN